MLSRILNKKFPGRKAQALILTYIAIASLTALLMPLAVKFFSENTILNTQKLQREALYFAEGGVDNAINQFINSIANFQTSSNVARYPSGTGVITTNYTNPHANGAQATAYLVAAGNQATVPDPDGINIIVKPYRVISTCTLPSPNSNITVVVNQIVIIRKIYTFQNAVFYNDDLELFPGKPMTFTGRIFSNRDIYLGSDNSTLTINSSYLHNAGNIYNARKDGGSNANGTVNIQVAGSSPASYVDMHNPPNPYPDPLDSTDSNWLADSQSVWNGTVKTSANGVGKAAVPVVGSIAPSGYYNSNASVVVTNGTITYNGTTLTQSNSPGANKIPSGTVSISGNTFYNAREGKYVRLATVDLKKLAGADGGYSGYTNYLPSNGLLYATVNDAGATQVPGVRLANGSQIYNSGLTVVTNDPLYIQGNYNTQSKIPSAVISDSVNILSKDWQDTNSLPSKGLSSRIAGETTVNAAFIAGVDTTTSGNYNGGLENYPRFLEDWTGKNLNISGSFIELWNAQVAQGAWKTSDVYKPPNRNWSYDTSLINSTPPFTPCVVEAQKGSWWKS